MGPTKGAPAASPETMTVHAIGAAAGKIWHVLHQHGGHVRLTNVRREVAMPESLVYMALGWLAREGKLDLRQQGRVIYVGLKP
ncbi:MAG TPA: winged helix-turn-helix domain-containing protein [bacterium]|nr:winged helix-turn-helix domain-containing protein [bacterium]